MNYIGSTNNLKTRFKQHNNGEEKFTSKYLPWELVYYESYKNEKDAKLRERKLKAYGASLGQLKKRIKYSLE